MVCRVIGARIKTMKKLLVIPFILALQACTGTLNAIIDDSATNLKTVVNWTADTSGKAYNSLTEEDKALEPVTPPPAD